MLLRVIKGQSIISDNDEYKASVGKIPNIAPETSGNIISAISDKLCPTDSLEIRS